MDKLQNKKLSLLYVTQKVDFNDDLLGAVHTYLSSLAKQADKLYVICLFKGEVRLPENCQVFSLGKEGGENNLKYVLNFYRFVLPLIFKKQINGIYIHMNQIYVYLLLPFRPILKLFHIPLVWWKAHANLNWQSKLARHFVDRVVTSVAVAYNIKTPKRIVVGQGIDTERFRPWPSTLADGRNIRIAVIGRLSPIRKYDLLLKAIKKVSEDLPEVKLKVSIYGQPANAGQQAYYDGLKTLQSELGLEDMVFFKGSVPNHQLPELINRADLVVNPGGSNSLDKAIVEAMACEKIVVDSNAATAEILEVSDLSPAEKAVFMFKRGDWEDLADKLEQVIKLEPEIKSAIGKKLRNLVVKNHNVDHLSKEIVKIFLSL
jgi:glycosyltransferase involved in cell wall biosynthesis